MILSFNNPDCLVCKQMREGYPFRSCGPGEKCGG